jgi:hypothetical protein
MANEADGAGGDEVLIFDPEEPLITFFFKLPEPIAVPEYTVFPERIHASALRLDWLERGTESEGVPGRRNLINTWVTGSSVIVHHIKIGLAASLGLDAVMKAAMVGIKGPGDYDLESGMPDDLSADSTVLEIVLPAWINLTLHRPKQLRNGANAADVRDQSELSGEQIDLLFDMAIDRVRHLQMAYHAVENGPITLLTAELLPPLVPFAVRTSAQIATKEVVELRIYTSGRSYNAVTRGEDLPKETIAAIFSVDRQINENPLSAYRELDREAFVALRRSGNTRVSVVMAAASAEVILDRTLLLLQWEEGKTPEAAAGEWRDALKTRVERDFADRLGGSWDLTADKPVGRWARNVAQVRNRVIHGGYLPSREEAEQAIGAARELVTFICDQLASDNNLRKYTRSAVLLAGNDGLRKRGRYTNAVKRLQANRSEPPWALTFAFWFKAFSRLRSDLLAPRQSTLEDSSLLAVYFPGDWPKWVAHDDSTGQAIEVHIPEEVELGDAREMVNQITTEHSRSENQNNPISISIAGGVVDGVKATGSWVEEYHLVPLRGVMVDWSNFTSRAT